MKRKVLGLLLVVAVFALIPSIVNAGNIDLNWQKNYGGTDYDSFNSVLPTTDGGYIAVGFSHSTDINGLTNKGDTDAIIAKYSKNGNLLWQKNYGGTGIDSFNSVLPTINGEYVVVGSSTSSDINGLTNKGDTDAIIVRYDKDGQLLWQKIYGGNDFDDFKSLVQTSDGGLVVVGNSKSGDINGLTNKGDVDAIILKYDRDGNLLWQKNYGGNNWDVFRSIIQLSDSSFIVVGTSDSSNISGLTNKGATDAIILKYDKNGNLLWQKNYGGINNDDFISVIKTSDDEFVAVGNSESSDIIGLTNKGIMDAIIVKYDKNGNLLWQKNYGGSILNIFESVAITTNDEFIAAGSSSSSDINGLTNKGNVDAILAKYDTNGNLLWQKNYGGSNDDSFISVAATADDGFVTVGNSKSSDITDLTNKGNMDAIIVKYSYPNNIIKNTTSNGTFSTDKTIAFDGDTVTITTTANTGYKVKTVKVNNSTIEVTKINDSYTFTMPGENVTIDVEFELIVVEEPKKEKDQTPKTGNSSNVVINKIIISLITCSAIILATKKLISK